MSLEEEFVAWVGAAPVELTSDAIWSCAAYRLATFAADRAWPDIDRLAADARTVELAQQLLGALGSIGANYTEAYSRRSVADRCRFYEYALGSAREARDWVFKARRIIGVERTSETLTLLTRIIQLLTVTIVRERPDHTRGAPRRQERTDSRSASRNSTRDK